MNCSKERSADVTCSVAEKGGSPGETVWVPLPARESCSPAESRLAAGGVGTRLVGTRRVGFEWTVIAAVANRSQSGCIFTVRR